MEEFISHSLEDTKAIGMKIAEKLSIGDVVAYKGSMGAGKTTLTRAIALALGADDIVSSPTFAIVNEYKGNTLIRHFDMYRIEDYDSLYSTGFFDYLDAGDSIMLIEWSENIEEVLPDQTLVIDIDFGSTQNERIFRIYSIRERV